MSRCWLNVGIVAGLWASLIAASALFTKQHYVADVVSGVVLAGVAYALFLRNCPRVTFPELDRRGAPVLVLGLITIYGLVVICFWVAYLMR